MNADTSMMMMLMPANISSLLSACSIKPQTTIMLMPTIDISKNNEFLDISIHYPYTP